VVDAALLLLWCCLTCVHDRRRPSAPLLYVNDDSPCNQSAWRALPSPVSSGPKEAALYDSVPAFVFPYTFADANKVCVSIDCVVCGCVGRDVTRCE
jgi:hypothetical protein